ncbi:MAG: hypothetical protein KatS3mg077_1731 [Candidatus Binatia bacterium]|nr:MAG: hypothetical protein KatS3mg077_1731 [Candidatus Binatia bacterium]
MKAIEPGRHRFARFFCTLGVVSAFVFVVASSTWAQGETDLAIRATSTSFQVGMPGRYVITVTNNGAAPTEGEIAVIAEFSPGLALHSSAGSWQCAPSETGATCTTSAVVRAGQSSTFSLTVSVAREAVPRASTVLRLRYGPDLRPTNNAVLKTSVVRPSRRPIPTFTPSPTFPPNRPTWTPTRTLSPTISPTPSITPSPTPTVTPIPASANLALAKAVSGRFVVGSNGTYILTVSNLGPNATNLPLVVTDTLPRGLSFVSASGTGWSCGLNAGAVECTHADALPVGSVTALTLVVRVGSDAYPTVTNVATLVYPADPDPSNNSVRRPTSIRR